MPDFFREYLKNLPPDQAAVLWDWVDSSMGGQGADEIIRVLASKTR